MDPRRGSLGVVMASIGARIQGSLRSSDTGPRNGWPSALGRWLFGRKPGGDTTPIPAGPVPRFRKVCISREAGSGASSVARLLGGRLGWKVFDHELVEAIAQGMQVHPAEVRVFDELATGLIQDWLLPLREEQYAPQEAYLDHLAKLVQSIGRAGDAILVGRGAEFLLPRSETLRVRLVAPLQARARRIADRTGVSLPTARRTARDLDHRRDRFIRALHRQDACDPHQYDLVLDTESLGLTIATELIACAVEAGMPSGPDSGAAPCSAPAKQDAHPEGEEL